MASYDPRTRRNTILIAEIVPTLKDGDAVDRTIPADRFYVHLGAARSQSDTPSWLSTVGSNATFAQWDPSEKTQYMRLANATNAFFGSGNVPTFIYPTGPFGVSPSYAPKNVAVSTVKIKFKARFNANADYTTTGIGANNGSASEFSTNTNHFIQVTRNSGSWELGSCDGATISQSSGGVADGSWHEFEVQWDTELRLYIDGALTITKGTNMPAQPLFAMGCVNSATNAIDIVDYLVEWS